MIDTPIFRPLIATVGTAGGVAAALSAILEAQGPIPSAVAAVLLAVAALIWQFVHRLRDERLARLAEVEAERESE